MITPWINYEAMQKIIVKQKNEFIFLTTPNGQPLDEMFQENSDDIIKLDSKASQVDQDDLGSIMEKSKTDKLHKTLEQNYTNGTNEHSKVRSRTIKIPFSTFSKIHRFRNPPIFNNVESTDELESGLNNEEMNSNTDDTNLPNKLYNQTELKSKRIKIAISTYVEIDNFLHLPIFGSTIQHTFKFINSINKQIPELGTKVFDTVTYYHEQPYCHLIGFKSHEIIFSTELASINSKSTKKEKDYFQSTVSPIHRSPATKVREVNNNILPTEYVNMRVPVIVGEYTIEICVEEDLLVDEKIYNVKEISREVELTNCKFVPDSFLATSQDGERKALKGKLFIEGYIHQSIDYIAIRDAEEGSREMKLENTFHPVHQKIVLELIIQMLQVQSITIPIPPNKLESSNHV